MADTLWYALVNGNQEGPFAEPQFRDLIARRQVRADTLVWSSPMPDWVKAGDVPGLFPPPTRVGPPPAMAQPRGAPLSGAQPRAATSYATAAQASEWPGGEPGAPLAFTGGTWGLFGRTLLVGLCQILIIPSPWANAAFYRWFVANVQLPNLKVVRFEGKGGDIWYIFMLLAVFSLASSTILAVPFIVLFYLIIMRWFLAKIVWEGRTETLRFTGGFWPFFGWFLLLWVSFISIIGWAWVITAMTRWICRHVEGTHERLSFVAGGWSVLWRIWVLALGCSFIIPIPWMLRWYFAWTVSQFALSERV